MSTTHENRFKQLGLNITYYRKLRNFNQETLAEIAGISRTHLSNIEAPNNIGLLTKFNPSALEQISTNEDFQSLRHELQITLALIIIYGDSRVTYQANNAAHAAKHNDMANMQESYSSLVQAIRDDLSK